MQQTKKTLGTNVLIERDKDGVFVVSLPGVQGAHADGKTLEIALKNLKEVIGLLVEHYGEKKFVRLVKSEQRLFGILPYDLDYV